MILNFDCKHVMRLLKHSIASTTRRVTFAQQYEEKYWNTAMSPERYQELRMAIDNDRFPNFQDEDFDYSKIPSGLWLVGDEGVYLMSNGHLKVQEDMSHVCYAEECNPLTMEFEDWRFTKDQSFGADDGVDFIPAASLIKVLQLEGEQTLSIELDQNSLTILSPDMKYASKFSV